MDMEEVNISDDVELLEESSQGRGLTRVLAVSLILLILLLCFGVYSISPLPSKISGDWHYREGGMTLTSKEKQWRLAIKDFQGVEGYTLSYQGQWENSLVNTYDGKEVTVQVELEREKFEEELLKELFVKNDLFEVTTDTPKKMVATYTKKGMKALFDKKNIDSNFHFKLESKPLNETTVLYLNSSLFSEERLAFKRK